MGKGQRLKDQRRAQGENPPSRNGGTRPLGGQPVKRAFPFFPVTIAVIVVVVGAVILWPSGSGTNKAPGGGKIKYKAYSKISVAGTDTLPKFEDTYTDDASADPAVGKMVPVVSGRQPNGKKISIGGAATQPRLIIVLAHWCPHCQKEVPILQKWFDSKDAPKGILLQSIATGSSKGRPNYPPSTWLANEGWTPPVLLDDDVGTVASTYGLKSFPYLMFVDADGKVVSRASGEMPISQVSDRVQAAIAASK